jgi:hypothetical protein
MKKEDTGLSFGCIMLTGIRDFRLITSQINKKDLNHFPAWQGVRQNKKTGGIPPVLAF